MMYPLTAPARVLPGVLMLALLGCQQQDAGTVAPLEQLSAPASMHVDEIAGTGPSRVVAAPVPAEESYGAEAEAPPLNLQIPSDILNESAETDFPVTERRYLPDLMVTKKNRKHKVSPELLFEEGEDVSLQSLSGARLKIEIPVD